MTRKLKHSYGCWPSSLTTQSVSLDSGDMNFLTADSYGVCFINSVNGEKDKQAVWQLSPNGELNRLTPASFNVRSRVHEYGGAPYCIYDDTLWFCNLTDQAIYRLDLTDRAVYRQALSTDGTPLPDSQAEPEPKPLTPVEPTLAAKLRFANFLIDPNFNRLICVREDHRLSNPDNFDANSVVNTLVSIDLESGGEGEILYAGSDFVSSPKLSPDGKTLVWQTWSHPNMPWDNTEIRLANFDGEGKLVNIRQIHQPKKGSLVQPQFDNKGQLYFIADWSDWWNLYRVSTNELESSCKAEALYPLKADFAPPQWLLGHQNYLILDDGSILASYTQDSQWHLGLLRSSSHAAWEMRNIADGYGQIENICSNTEAVFFSAATPTQENAIHRLPLEGKTKNTRFAIERMSLSAETKADISEFSQARTLCFKTANDDLAYGNFYPPTNSQYTGLVDTLPPLIVSVHGGPTSSAKTSLNLKLQYWTSRGFAVIDVNHRGSTGFGRKFRQSLYPNWGLFDLQDIEFCVRHLINEGLVDPMKIAIRGGSAGGYSVMAALSQSNLFAAGASYYGISDLEVLTQGTHKFESRYLDQLIGPYPEAKEIYRARSPIYNIDKISAPLLLLQGLEDKVVPPDQAEGICNKLKMKGVDVRYLDFEGEGHGFRQLQNQVLAMETELSFYQEVLKLRDS
jgi:dipeptidyl aminopeptidase/acylaminoacyl peptidase